MKKLYPAGLVFALAFFILPFSANAAAPAAPSGFAVQTVVSGLALPTDFAFASDGRIFITQKGGSVRVIKNGALLPTPVITLPDVNDFADRGLESVALDPNFAQNGYMYLAYTHENTPGTNYTGSKTGRMVRVTVSGDTADLASEVVILGSVGGDAAHPSCRDFATTSDCIPSDANTHSMGDMHFGIDGKLYATLGDGAGYLTADPLALDAQDPNSLGGKLVRINTDGAGIADNPFWSGNANDNRSKVWSLGHRNSYRFTIRPSDQKIFFGDVGWATWEELNVGAKGANYGWPCREGHVATSYNCTPSTTASEPIYVYDHSSGSGSVIGGSFGSVYASGNYFFGDYSGDYIKRVVLNSDDTVVSVNDFITNAGGPVSIQTGPDGNLYYAAINVGELRKVVATGTGTGGDTGGTGTTTVGGTNQNADPAPHFVQATVSPDTVIGHQETITATVRNDGGAAPFIVDLEVVNKNDPTTLLAQKSYDGVTLAQGTNGTYTLQWMPPHVGDYYLKVGLFKQNWAGLWEWTEQALVLPVIDRSGTTTTPTDPVPHLTSATMAPTPAQVGTPATLTAHVHNSGGTVPFVVDLELVRNDAPATLVAQKFYDTATLAQNADGSYDLPWTPATAGDYTLKVGLFKQNWAGLFEWDEPALAIHVGSTGSSSAPATPHLVSVAANPTQGAVGVSQTLTATVRNQGGSQTFLADLELYNSAGVKVAQQFYDATSIDPGATKPYTLQWTPAAGGDYTLKVGFFKPGWGSVLEWNDIASIVHVGGVGTSSQPIFSAHTSVSADVIRTSSWGSQDSVQRVTVTVTNSGGAGDMLLDIEMIKDPYIFGQDIINNVHFAAGETKTFVYDFPVPYEGQYGVTSTGNFHVDIGVMHNDWSAPWVWYNSAATFTAVVQ